MRKHYSFILLFYIIATCMEIDAWGSLGFRHFFQQNNNRANESLSAGTIKGKLQPRNFQTGSQTAREKRREFKIYSNFHRYSAGRNNFLARRCLVFPLFTFIKFDNNVCIDTNGENGTCVTASECLEQGGISSGICANGYGVCCIGMILFLQLFPSPRATE